jgi:DNA-binding NarL/FixJ family response regulator
MLLVIPVRHLTGIQNDSLKERDTMKDNSQPKLTPREIEVVQLIWEEYSAKEIGSLLGISPRTVEAHRWNIATKVRAKSTVGIVKFALKEGIIKLD